MYGRVVRLTPRNQNEARKLCKEFIDNLYFHPMYEPLVENLKQQVGFAHKASTVYESAEKVKLITSLAFDTQENYELYANEESTQELWNYLFLFADEEGFDVDIVDGEQNLNF